MKQLYYTLYFTLTIFWMYPSEHLFINSHPIRANILINGEDTKIITPCLLKHDQINKTVIILSRKGYKDYTLTPKEIETGNVSITLIPVSFDLYFPEKNTYKIGSTLMKGPVYVSGLKPGTYEVDLLDDKMTFTDSNAFLPYEASLGTAFAISLFSMIGSTIASEYCANQAWNYKNTNQTEFDFYSRTTSNIDIAKFISIGLTSALAVALTSVIAVDVGTKLSNKTKNYTLLNKSPSNQDDNLFLTAMQFTSSGEIDRSTQIMKTIISLYPESDHIPLIHYYIGQNYFITGNLKEARNYWEKFVLEYPISNYYDYVLKNLADIYLLEKNFDRARFYLDKAVYTDTMLTRESISSLKAKIDFERYTSSPTKENFSVAEAGYRSVILDFKHSESLDNYYFMLLKLYKLSSSADKINMLKKEIESADIDPIIKELTLSYF